jgi:hypothetical protein
MRDKAISPLRRRLIEDMTIRRLSPKTHYQYIRHIKKFADFLGRSVDKAAAEDVHHYQLWLASIGTLVGTAKVSANALRFVFKITLKRPALAEGLIWTREPTGAPHMDVDLTIRYSDYRLCEITASRPDTRAGLSDCFPPHRAWRKPHRDDVRIPLL